MAFFTSDFVVSPATTKTYLPITDMAADFSVTNGFFSMDMFAMLFDSHNSLAVDKDVFEPQEVFDV